MNKLEYLEKRCAINEVIIDRLCRVVGNALPHTQGGLANLMDYWQDAIDDLDAKFRDMTL